ncbi:MAG: c-type cytochrome [Bryobacterales bacterium]|nr:c-type cytochrome [Bryobacterales bacterium]
MPSRAAADGVKFIQLDPAWQIELWASEPMFADPVAMEIDEHGRTYVVQNSGYPLDTEHKLGKVWLLEDANGDGKPDKSTLFAGDLMLPTGVMRWKKGILVTDAPDVLYLEDTDGDGKADVREAVLTGFAFTNPQHTVNSPVYGLDNWIYLAHEGFASAVVYAQKFGDRGADIRFPARGNASPRVKNERRNIRFRIDSPALESTSSTSQFGIVFDDYGRLLTANNSNHARHEVIAARYLARNPDLLLGSSMQDVSDHGGAAQVFSVVKDPRFELLSGTGIFTSACSITWWNGGTVIAEPVHGLVHRDVWKPAGATFTASRAKEGVEFLASTDPWFRPVNFYLGPDGALYVLDYYRKVIEHPEWTSRETAEAKDIYDGQTMGRIYRVTPREPGDAAPGAAASLGKAGDEELVRQLANPHVWWRRNAQRLLMDRRSERAVEPLRQMVRASHSPLGRVHALWALDGLGKLDAALLGAALGDAEPGVRENAIVLAEPRLGDAALVDALLKREADPDARVRFQLLATLGSVATPAAAATRQRLLDRDMEDAWFQAAALSSSAGDALAAFHAALGARWTKTPGRASYLKSLGSILGARGRAAELSRVLSAVASSSTPEADWWRAAALEGLAAGLRARHSPLAPQPALVTLYEDASPAVRHAALRLIEIAGLPPARRGAMLQQAATLAADRAQPADRRADAVALLALAPAARTAEFYQKFVEPSEPEALQTAAVQALGKLPGAVPAQFLLSRWRSLTPAVRNAAGEALLASPERFPLLLAAIGNGEIQPWSLPPRMRLQMQMNRDPALREQARTLIAAQAGDREEVVRKYQAALTAEGDPSRGQAVFERTCAKCHKMDGKGPADVGPDLATIRNRTAASLLGDILMPSRGIAQMYESYVIETASRGTLDGVISQQTATTITLVHEEGKQDVVPRSDIREMRVSNLSAMPEDLDQEVSVPQMADLLAYLKKPR